MASLDFKNIFDRIFELYLRSVVIERKPIFMRNDQIHPKRLVQIVGLMILRGVITVCLLMINIHLSLSLKDKYFRIGLFRVAPALSSESDLEDSVHLSWCILSFFLVSGRRALIYYSN